MIQSQLKKVRVNDIDLHYVDIGSGNPVVFLHGGGATDYRTWTPVIGNFMENYRVVVPSLRYHYPNEWVGDGLDYTPDPTLLLRGDSSPKEFLLADEELAKNMPGAERALIPNAAHLLHGMNPKVYSDVVLSFLAKH